MLDKISHSKNIYLNENNHNQFQTKDIYVNNFIPFKDEEATRNKI